MSSFIYILNDLFDRKRDREHPIKQSRPIASGKIKISTALITAIVIAVIAIFFIIKLNFFTIMIIAAFTFINILYSMWLKHVVLVDVFCITLGFLFRLLAGGLAIGVELSSWIIITTIFISFFIGFAKRRNEIIVLDTNTVNHRPVLDLYSVKLLDYLIIITGSLTLFSYSMYAISVNEDLNVNNILMIITVLLVIYGVFRYLFLVYKQGKGGDPVEIMITDLPLVIDIVLWFIIIVIIYFFGYN